MKVISSEKVPIKIWTDKIEDSCLEQVKNLTNLPMAFYHVSLMPDCHAGMGMPIGGVIALRNTVIVNAVGVDIGCGMACSKSNFKGELSIELLEKIRHQFSRSIPVGFRHNKDQVHEEQMPFGYTHSEVMKKYNIVAKEYQSARYQLGSLGSGNHFLEIQRDEDGFIWIMIHSGSRNLGKKICDYYNQEAEKMCAAWYVKYPANLAWLPTDSELGKAYLNEMNYALEFAYLNRMLMLNAAISDFASTVGEALSTTVSFGERINIHHNYASLENHFRQNVWVHRKGATLARKGTIGIIPGSMGTSSYIVEGLGNRDSFESCSHGAGRTMGRKEYTRTHTKEECDKQMEGIVHGKWSSDRKGNIDLSEAPGAYKSIESVMENQKDLVSIVHKLKPLAVLKG